VIVDVDCDCFLVVCNLCLKTGSLGGVVMYGHNYINLSYEILK
jgi:hypothetical protein